MFGASPMYKSRATRFKRIKITLAIKAKSLYTFFVFQRKTGSICDAEVGSVSRHFGKTFLLRVTKALAAVFAFIIFFFALQRLLMPKYASAVPEGGMIQEYYKSTPDHDVIFIGDCEVYTSYSPVTLWEEYGITSYVRGSPQQLVWQSYYLLEDTLRYETPKIVIFNVLAMQFGQPQSEPYNRLTLDGMRMSQSKLRAISASRMDDEDLLSYFFPFFRYKDRWKELSTEDLRYFFHDPGITVNGFMIRSDISQAGYVPDPMLRADYQFGEKAFIYLERMASLAKKHGIELILVKAPTLYPHWYEEWEEQVDEFAKQNDLLYINFSGHIEDIGLDYSTDTYNAGVSLNVYGAERLTKYVGTLLRDRFDLPDRRNETDTAACWDEISALYHRIIAKQQEEISLTGKIQTFRAE